MVAVSPVDLRASRVTTKSERAIAPDNGPLTLDLARPLGGTHWIVRGLSAIGLIANVALQESDLTPDQGRLRSVTGTTPAAGAEITETVPGTVMWELMSFRWLLAASVAVANRFPELIIDDGTNELVRIGAPAAVAASATARATYLPGAPSFVSSAGANWVLPIGNRQFIGRNYRIRTSTAGLQAADQFGGVQYQVREWPAINPLSLPGCGLYLVPAEAPIESLADGIQGMSLDARGLSLPCMMALNQVNNTFTGFSIIYTGAQPLVVTSQQKLRVILGCGYGTAVPGPGAGSTLQLTANYTEEQDDRCDSPLDKERPL